MGVESGGASSNHNPRDMHEPIDNGFRASPVMADEGGEAGAREPLTPAEVEYVKELYERHEFALRQFLKHALRSSEDAREIAQETYLRILRQRDFARFRANAKAYLFQTAANLARDAFRERTAKSLANEGEAFVAGGFDTPDWTTWPEAALQGEQVGSLVIAALKEMDAAMRRAVLLHRFRELTHREIATCLNVSERTVERYIKEGLRRITKRLEGQL